MTMILFSYIVYCLLLCHGVPEVCEAVPAVGGDDGDPVVGEGGVVDLTQVRL